MFVYLDEMDGHTERHNLPKLTQGERDNLNKTLSIEILNQYLNLRAGGKDQAQFQ